MLLVAKYTLGPLLLAQARWLRHTAIRLPEPEGERQGMAPASHAGASLAVASAPAMRVLVVGDSSAAGVGVAHQQDALAPQVAAQLSERIRAPVAWQLVARSGVNTAESLALVEAATLQPADAIVCALGVNDVATQRTPAQFIDDYRALITLLRQRTGASAAVLSGLPPMHRLPAAPQPLRWYLGACARQLDLALQQWCAADPSLRHLSLQWAQPQDMAADRYHPGRQQYREWAALVADQVMPLWHPDAHRPSRPAHETFMPGHDHATAAVHADHVDAAVVARHTWAEAPHETP